jgi:TonB family protein
MNQFLKFFLLAWLILNTDSAHAQTGIATPTYHVDTATYTWKGKSKHKMRQGEWTGTCKIFRSTAYGVYVDGKLNGPWTVLSGNGRLQEEGTYINGLRNGKWVTYNNLGDTTLLCYYKLGVLDGVYKTFYVGNLITRQGLFVNGIKEGKWVHTVYTATRRLHARTTYMYVHDVLEGPVTLQTYQGTKTSWYESGKAVRSDSTNTIDTSFANVPWPPPEDPVLSFAEEMPRFGDGDPNENLQKYLAENIRYPESAVKNKKEGTCYVQFTVERDGSITDVVLKKGVAGAPELGEEAVRVIESMPPWNPGRMAGRPVRVTMTIPIKFAL